MLNPGVAGLANSEKRIDIVIQERDYIGAAITLKGTADGGVLRYINNEEEKYPQIQASELDILFYSESNFSLEEIITDDDYQYMVVVMYVIDTIEHPVWYGFLSTDDCEEQMQSDPKQIKLKATDGLGYLKDQELYNSDVYEKRDLLKIIRDCLNYIPIEIPLLIEVNVFEESMQDRSDILTAEPFSQCKVHTRSFLKDENTFNNCFDILVDILGGFECTLLQANGMWIIHRKHDRWNQDLNYGTLYGYMSDTPIATNIGYKIPVDRKERFPINADHLRGFISAKKYTRINYNYRVPEQIPRNSNFEQGDFYPPIGGTGVDEDGNPTIKIANLINHWQYLTDTGSPMPTSPYRVQVVDSGTNRSGESYIVLPTDTGGYLKSETIEVDKGDKLNITGEYTTLFPGHGETTALIMIILQRGTEPAWTLFANQGDIDLESGASSVDGIWLRAPKIGQIFIRNAQEAGRDKWVPFNVQTPSFPVSGLMHIRIYNSGGVLGYDSPMFKNLKFNWSLYVNDSIAIKGEYDKLIENDLLRTNLTQDVKIGDSPKRIISGALFQGADETKLTRNWHRQGKNESERLIRLNDIALRQSTNRLYTKIDGSFLNITYNNNRLVSPLNLFYFSSILNKFYFSTNLEISFGTNTFRATLQEFYDTTKDNGDHQGDVKDFQYIYE